MHTNDNNKSKKVAIISCYFQHNFGSQLQAYATQKILDDWGIENETIRIDGILPEIKKAKYKYFRNKLFHLATIKDKSGHLKRIIQLKLNKDFSKNIDVRAKKFKEFANSMFKLSNNYDSKLDLGKSNDFDAFLVGSDQLWLPSNIEADYYTLNFVPDGIPKIAFATSFGISNLPTKQALMAKRFLIRFQHLSTRENTGQNLIHDLINKKVPVVCDPTLLFTEKEWLSIQDEKPIIKEKYIFSYFLGNNPWQRELVTEIKEKTGYQIVQLPHLDEYIKSDESFADYKLYDVGPKEYLNLIRNAEIIFADSFHGTVFSILHKKPFFTLPRYSKNNTVSTNSRLNSILELLNLKERFLKEKKTATECLNMKIDYNIVHHDLAKFRNESKEYLRSALLQSGFSL